jgi:hypothetical protein
MEVDVPVDLVAMQSIVRNFTGPDAGVFVTMDDVEYERIARIEDGGGGNGQRSSGDEDDEEEEDHNEDVKQLQESDGEESDDEDSDDDEEEEEEEEYNYEDNSFQTRLDRLRAFSKEQNVADADSDEDDEDDDLIERNMTWADEDEAFLQHLNVGHRRFC